MAERPDNGFKVGHAGAVIAFTVKWSTGQQACYIGDACNQDVVKYILNEMVETLGGLMVLPETEKLEAVRMMIRNQRENERMQSGIVPTETETGDSGNNN